MNRTPSDPPPADEIGLIRLDPWLAPFAAPLRQRSVCYTKALQRICDMAGSLPDFALAHQYFGFNRGTCDGQSGVWFREWAPGAIAMTLIGDFNGWNRSSHPLTRDQFGNWSIFLPDADYADRLTHGSRVKVHVHSAIGPRDRIPTFIRRVVSEPGRNNFDGQYWQPPTPYVWQHPTPPLDADLRIYETHIGMATEEERVGTYREFTTHILPRIVAAGYNTVQIMAILEHPYYGSFGYQVSNFFAPSSRFGTPEELKELIDAAHGAGLRVLLDLVHSHAVKNMEEGLNHFDGTDYQFFHASGRGQHPAWDSLCFDYAKIEVQRFLLSNVRYWLEEFHFDGFRFDGVTSMIYFDHGFGRDFASYDHYFPPYTDEDAINYLQLANELAHTLRPDVTTIAEDVSGLAGMARPVAEGGVGFDYRLAMGLPDYWIRIIKHQRDEDWNMGQLYHTLLNRRPHEKHVAYVESHDQALVGDKTIAMRLMDADIYFNMQKGSQNLVIERGMALHKMIRLVTFLLGGEAWLNFMGNEFGHPEWIDFPREGNQYSYKYARRQWSLVDDPMLRYNALGAFDKAMTALDQTYRVLTASPTELLQVHEDNKLLAFRRGPLVAVFNFHPTRSLVDYRIGLTEAHDQRLIVNTDDLFFGGHAEVPSGQHYPWQQVAWDDRPQSIQLYIPARSALVLATL